MALELNLDTTIKELYEWGRISVRTYNSLHAAGLDTLGEVIDSVETPMGLLSLRNFGRKAYTEIEPILNIMIRGNVAQAPQTKDNRLAALGEKIAEIVTEAYNTVTQGDMPVKGYLRATYPHPYDMHKLVMGDVENMLTIVGEYTREENLEIRHSFKRFIEIVVGKMEYAQETESDYSVIIYTQYKRMSMRLAVKMEDFGYEQTARYFLSPIARDYLEKTYQKQVAKDLGVRSRNFAAKFLPHFSDLIRYADEPLANYRNICPGQNMMKTLTEIFQFNQKFKSEFDWVSRLTDDEIQTEILKSEYPYLSCRQRQFVSDFIKENGHAPLLFLMLQYLRLSENRSNKIYCLYYGIFDGRQRTLNEIADAINLSRERVRQIVFGTIEVQETALVNNEGWESYKNLFEQPFIYEKTAEYAILREAEHLPDCFVLFASLVCLVAEFEIEDVKDHTILVNKKHNDLKIKDCLNTLSSIINAKYAADTYVPIDNVLLTVSPEFREAMRELITYIAANIYKVQITADGQLFLPQNYIDISEELYDILAKKGEPMHVEEIFLEFKRRYPEHKYTEPMQIKSSLYKHKHIRAVGKTSCYALDSWEGVYFGSIRDLLVDMLSASDVPLHIDTLYDGVAEYYPNTSRASVAATMEDEDLQRFVEFEGGYFGLTSKDYSSEYVVATTVQHYRFEERLQMFQDFVTAYHRFPSYNGSEQEASLIRWLYNVTNGILTMTDEQKAQLDETLLEYDRQGFPRSATEAEFLLKCQDVKDYIRQNHTLPTKSKAPELYAWLRRSRDNYDSYTDKRRQYMTDLLNYILSLGFSI